MKAAACLSPLRRTPTEILTLIFTSTLTTRANHTLLKIQLPSRRSRDLPFDVEFSPLALSKSNSKPSTLSCYKFYASTLGAGERCRSRAHVRCTSSSKISCDIPSLVCGR
ncbi:hypothetical protein C8F04DRAFT_1073258 [Mycena alexandri]|uniref:Uncharacterized protein n=1 Tax=Mycena alexandri TaxID=1745969 RepID=A0AAD6TDQ0_9AGAR|nr:hypothetical protein C8F04DRAFT_1073258 [Mycena alexandri]